MLEHDKSFNELVKELGHALDSGGYRNEVIRRTLTEKPFIRKAYALLLIKSPARFGEIKEKCAGTRRTIYGYLYTLVELGLAKKISVMDLWNKEEKLMTEEEKSVLKKFKIWTKNMAKGQLQNFAGRTNYWILTEIGKDVKTISWVLKLEKERRVEKDD